MVVRLPYKRTGRLIAHFRVLKSGSGARSGDQPQKRASAGAFSVQFRVHCIESKK